MPLRNLVEPLKIFGIFLLLNILFVVPYYASLGFLNEDTALIEGAIAAIESEGIGRLFYTSYGPRVIRPLQLVDMYFGWKLFGMRAFPLHCPALLLVAAAQAILFFALRGVIGTAGAGFAACAFAFSAAASEARFWLSDRHDLYLLLFFSLSLFTVSRYFKRALTDWRSILTFVVLISFTFWGGFYSNEKGTAIPAVICALATAYLFAVMGASRDRKAFKLWGVLVVVAVANTIAYFLFRRWILGEFIGGYNSLVLPAEGMTLDIFRRWTLTLFTAVFRQSSETLVLYAALVAAPAVMLAMYGSLARAVRSRTVLHWILCFVACLGALYLSSVPTLQFSIAPPAVGTLSSRFLWLPSIVASVLLGILLGSGVRSYRSSELRGATVYAFLAVLVFAAYGGREALFNYTRASEYTRQVITGYRTYCACMDREATQFEGLFPYPFGVVGFTEKAWLFFLSSAAGMRDCTLQDSPEERACKFSIRQSESGAETSPLVISPSLQAQLLAEAPTDIFSESNNKFQGLRTAVEDFPTTSDIMRGGTFIVSGWAREQKSARPVALVALLADNQILVAAPPNAKRDARVNPNRLKGESKPFGFTLGLDTRRIPKDAKVVRLCVAGRSNFIQDKWAMAHLS